MDQRVATALLSYLTQTAYQAGQALQDARLDNHDTEILALQNAGPFATAGDLSNLLQVTLQSAIDGILAEIATLGGATNLVNTWGLLAGTNTVRNLHATGPLSIQLANDDWTLSFSCDAYTTQQTDDAIAAALSNYFTRAEEVTATIVAAIDESKGYTDTQLADYTTAQMTQAISDALVPFETAVQRDAAIAAALAAYYTSAQTDAALAAGLVPYSTTAQMNQAIADALLPYGTVAQRDAAIAAALAAYYTSAQTDAAIAAAIAPYYTSAETDAAIAAVQLSNGQTWNGGPTFNLLRGSNVLRNLSVPGALTASFQNLDDTILIESDSYARSETYTQAETGVAITAAIDALDLSQFQNEAEVQALIAAALSTYVAGELANYATSSSVTSAISSALSSYDDSSQVDSKIITALLDFYTRTEVDQEIANALGKVDLSNYYTQAETQSYVAGELLAYYPRTELDSQLTATFLQYWTSSRTQTEIDDAIAGAGFLTQAQADTRRSAPTEASSTWCAPTCDAPNDQGAPASGAPGGQHHPLGHHARAHLRRLHQGGSGRALFEQQQLRAARRQVLPQQRVGGRGQRPLPPRPGAVHAPLHPQPALLPPPSSLLPPPPSSLLPPSSSLLPPPPSPLLRPPPPKALKDGHGTTARAIRHARSPQRVRRRAQGWARHHSESAPTHPIPAEGSPASDPTRPIPAEGSPASSRIRTAPQRERSDTPDPRRGFIGELKDSHGTTPIPAEGSPASDPTRPIPAEGSPASSRIRTAPQRERSDTPDPRRGFIGELKDSHGTTPIPAEGSPASDPTRPIPAEGSSASSRIRTAPHRSPQRVRRRAIRHARSPQRVRRRAQGFARHHSESAPTRPIPVEGSSASSRIRTAPQRERSDTPDPCRGFIGVEGSSASSRIRTAPQREFSDTPDPCRGFIGELKDGHGTTARALRHARSL